MFVSLGSVSKECVEVLKLSSESPQPVCCCPVHFKVVVCLCLLVGKLLPKWASMLVCVCARACFSSLWTFESFSVHKDVRECASLGARQSGLYSISAIIMLCF